MLRRFSIDFAIFSIGLDAVIIAFALALASTLRPLLSNLTFIKYIPNPLHTPASLYVIFPLLWVAILGSMSVYDGRRNLRFWRELASLSVGSILAVIALAGVLYLSFREISRVLFLIFALMAFSLLILWRMVIRMGYRVGVLKNVQPRNILIVGNNSFGHELEEHVLAYQSLGLSLVGFIDNEIPNQIQGEKVLGSLANICQVVEKWQVDDVVIALPPSAFDQVPHVVSDLGRLPIKVWVIPDYFKLALYKTNIEEFAGLPMVDLRAPALSETQHMVKRLFDLTLCLIFLPIGLLVMGIIALVIHLDSQGPVLFKQTRVGENGRLFKMIKFRTMVTGAEGLGAGTEHTDGQQRFIPKNRNDPRITRAGSFLRKASLDEIPQVFNVLKGEMSLVGPRPELPYLVEKYEPWQHRRFCVPPGVTGWWQVTGRSDKPMHLHTEDDLYYIENYSVFLDLLILIKTVGGVLRGTGAY